MDAARLRIVPREQQPEPTDIDGVACFGCVQVGLGLLSSMPKLSGPELCDRETTPLPRRVGFLGR